MSWRFAKVIVEDFVELGDMIYDTLVGYGRELAELGEDPVRTRQGIVAACSVMLATFLALLLEEKGEGDLEQVARAVHAKLVRQQPRSAGLPVEANGA